MQNREDLGKLTPLYPVCTIHRLFRGVKITPQGVSYYDTKKSDCEVPVNAGVWGMFSGPEWLAPDAKVNCLKKNCFKM